MCWMGGGDAEWIVVRWRKNINLLHEKTWYYSSRLYLKAHIRILSGKSRPVARVSIYKVQEKNLFHSFLSPCHTSISLQAQANDQRMTLWPYSWKTLSLAKHFFLNPDSNLITKIAFTGIENSLKIERNFSWKPDCWSGWQLWSLSSWSEAWNWGSSVCSELPVNATLM